MTNHVKKNYPICYNIVEETVKPQRAKVNKPSYRDNWWLYAEKGRRLYKKISKNKKVLVTARVSKTLGFSFIESSYVYDDKLVVFDIENFKDFLIIQSTFHNAWAWQYSTKMKSDLSYTPRSVFQTFPFPQNISKEQENRMEQIGEAYHEHRRQLMLKMQLGLTKTYNAFHAREITAANLTGLDKKAIEKQYGKEVWNLWNHLQKTPGTCTFAEAVTGIVKLRELHVEMDQAVLEAYGWAFDSAQASGIKLKHDFYEVDYLPENDRVRYTIHPEARKEILKRLLELNHQIHEEEVKAGLRVMKKAGKKEYPTMGFESGDVAKEDEGKYGQGSLF